MPPKHRILFVHSSAELYGSDRCLISLVAGLISNSYDVHVALPTEGALVERLTTLGARVHILETVVLRRDLISPRAVFRLIFSAPLAAVRLASLIRQEKIDLVHTNTGVVLGGGLAARLTGRPHVWHFREMLNEFGALLRGYEYLVGLLSTRLIFITEAVRGQFHSRRLKCKGEVIYDGIAPETFSDIKPESDGALLNIATIGRLAVYKGQDILIQALAELARSQVPFEAYIIGDVYADRHDYRDSLKQMTRQLGIDDKVHFVGFQTDIKPFLEKCNVFVLSSVRQEGLGIVLLEAMAARRAVVASRGGGPLEVIENDRNGMLFKTGVSAELADVLIRLYRNPDDRKRLAEAGYQSVRERFSEQAMVDGVIRLYQEIFARRAAVRK